MPAGGNTSGESILLGDIGGTNARFAVLRGEIIGHAANLKVASFAEAGDAIDAYIKGLADGAHVDAAAIAVAGPVKGRSAKLTNGTWRLDAAEIETRFKLSRVRMVNDFAAQAWAIPRLDSTGLRKIGGGETLAGAPSVVVGPGTGLGVASYLPPPAGPAVIVGEGGHATMPATDDRGAAILAALRARFGHASAERVLSGEGMVNLYDTIAELDGETPPRRNPAEITKAALAKECPVSQATLDQFCAMLGTVAGNLALTLGAQGGVYISGGIGPRVADYFAESRFRARFEDKGRFKSYLAPIPTWLVAHPAPAFLGLAEFWSSARGL
jgi:glucokinase